MKKLLFGIVLGMGTLMAAAQNGSPGKNLENKLQDTTAAFKPARALKVELLSPLSGGLVLNYERQLRQHSSLEYTLGGFIRPGMLINTNVNAWETGMLMGVGWKYIFNGQFSHHINANPLSGFYLKPELLVNLSKQHNAGEAYGFAATLLFNAGKQWVIKDRFYVDTYTGVGQYMGSALFDGRPVNVSINKIAFNAGIKLGIKLK